MENQTDKVQDLTPEWEDDDFQEPQPVDKGSILAFALAGLALLGIGTLVYKQFYGESRQAAKAVNDCVVSTIQTSTSADYQANLGQYSPEKIATVFRGNVRNSCQKPLASVRVLVHYTDPQGNANYQHAMTENLAASETKSYDFAIMGVHHDARVEVKYDNIR
jgi:hypothetical protein